MNNIQFIRDSYQVPAKRGGQIIFTDIDGHRWSGRIKGASYGLLRVAIFPNKTSILHPTWNIEYLDSP